MTTDTPTGDALPPAHLDPKRWFTLVIVVTAVVIAALDGTVLNVAIPTILREFHTELPSLQWVVTGYSLTFASLLIIGGRLGDIYGARRMFIIGASFFGVGSFLAAVSQSVPTLFLGEALIEGIGASLMLPSTLSILSNTFQGRERSTAFAAWGATAGAAIAFGPVIGGFLTTNYSWRWAFGINVVVVPFAIVGAMLFMRKAPRAVHRPRLDIPGAAMIASRHVPAGVLAERRVGIVRLVASRPRTSTIGGLDRSGRRRASRSRSPRPRSSLAIAVIAHGVRRSYERAKERRRDANPLFEFSQLRYHKTFRYGLLITIMILSMGQLSLLFALPLSSCRTAEHLSAQENGLLVAACSASFVIVGAQVGGRLTRRIGVATVGRALGAASSRRAARS